MSAAREVFSNRFTVIMAMAGSAIGLGNIWRFPYIVGENGGAAFILVYLAACLLLALPIFFCESIIGRRGGSDTFGSLRKLAPGSKWYWVGLLTIITAMLVLSYYSVVGGWSVDYLFRSVTLQMTRSGDEAIAGMFPSFISSTWRPLITHTVFIVLSGIIVLLGVKKGIEWFTKITIPALFILIIVIAVYSLTLPGSGKGVEYLLKPDFSKLTAKGVGAAVGQAFFSMSLGMGTILTYASYMHKGENMLSSGIGTAVSDLLFACLAGFAIMPAVFAAGIAPGTGPGLVFNTLPFVFHRMGAEVPAITTVVSTLFFLSVLMAALTSSISILEVGVAYLTDERKMDRRAATLLLVALVWAGGVLCSLSFGVLSDFKILGNTIFDFLDQLCSNWLMPLGGLLFTLFVGWKMKRVDVWKEFTNDGYLRTNDKLFPVIYIIIRYLAPLGIGVVFLVSVL